MVTTEMSDITNQLVGPVCDGILLPALKIIASSVTTVTSNAYHRFNDSYKNYLLVEVKRHSYFISIFFGSAQKLLIDYYQPLTIYDDAKNIKIESYPDLSFSHTKKILIVDNAGMGKTTLLKFLFVKCVEQRCGVPVFVELRKLSSKTKLTDLLVAQLTGLNSKENVDLFLRTLDCGKFVFFLDGYDEISYEDRDSVSHDIIDFTTRAGNNTFIMTSRDELGLTSFPDFQKYKIKNLEKYESYELIAKYGGKERSDALINQLKLPENVAINEFLVNPMLTSLLFVCFEYKHIIPLKRNIFYRQVYDALYESHDLTKGSGEFQRTKRSGLDVDKFERLLCAFGAVTYKDSKIELTKDEAIDYIEKAKKITSENVSSSSILDDLTHAVPLMIKDGLYFRWNHRSIQEYFAAKYICQLPEDMANNALLSLYKNFSIHMNLFSLCADINISYFERSIGSVIAQDMLSQYSSHYNDISQKTQNALIEERKCWAAGRKLFLVMTPENLVKDTELFQQFTFSVHAEMTKKCGISEYGSTSQHSKIGLGEVFTHESSFISNAMSKNIKLPFIIDNIRIYREYICPFEIHKSITFIDEDKDSTLNNTEEAFSFTNSMISGGSAWKFDANAAKTYLKRIHDERKEKEASEPWL
jgi:hypothetical protein